VGSKSEGWKLVDTIEEKSVCRDPPEEALPHVIHYCQRYMLGKWFIGKYRLRKDFISCNAPLLREPPSEIVNKTYQITPDGAIHTFKDSESAKYNAFMLCQIIPKLNQAAEFFKEHHCEGKNPNFNKTYIFHETMEEKESLFLQMMSARDSSPRMR
jgi:hypothetical protein